MTRKKTTIEQLDELKKAWDKFVYALAESLGIVWLLDKLAEWLNNSRHR